MSTAAIVDIGSNSIKILVAKRDPIGRTVAVYHNSLDVRISTGINATQPMLGNTAMTAGLEAIQELLSSAATYSPQQVILVATSAVREASNGAEFCSMVQTHTGHPIRILSGDEEAASIGRGLLCDPMLDDWRNFTLVDIGGGSLECLSFVDRQMANAASLPLGCVRLTEQFVTDRQSPMSTNTRKQIIEYTGNFLKDVEFSKSTEITRCIVTGGSIVSIRSMVAAKSGIQLRETSPCILRSELDVLLDTVADMTLAERHQIPGLPKARADIFPTAIATLIGVADHLAVSEFNHSFFNLRFGIADELL